MKNLIIPLYKIVSILSLCILFCIHTFATNYTWNGNTSTAWTTTSNWTPNGTPTSTDNVTIATGTYAPLLSANVTVNNFTITGNTLNLNGDTITINGTGNFSGGTITNGLLKPSGSTIQFNGTVIDAKVDAVVTKVLLDGSTFNKKCYFEATSNIPGTSAGGNTFNDTVTIKRAYTGSGIMYLGNSSGNVFNKLLTLINVGTKEIVTTTTGGSKFNENVIVENTSSGGINFGYSTTGSDTLASGKTVTISSNGFTTGTLLFCNFTQLGSTAQSLTVTSSAIINLIRATFSGNVTLTAPGILCKASIFSGTFTSTTNGSTNTSWSGYNFFNGDASITNTSTSADVRLDNDSANTFYGNLTLTTSSSKDIKMCFSSSTTSVYGNVTGNNSHVTFNSGTGTLAFRGGNAQTFNSPGAIVKDVLLKKSANSVTLDTTLTCTATFTFNKGNIVTSANHLLVFNAGSSVSGASDTSFVSGPVKKIGSTSFVFPVGKINYYRGLTISAPSSGTDAFVSEFLVDETPVNTSSRDATLGHLFRKSYWKLNRTNGSSQVYVTLSWNSNVGIIDTSLVIISGWNGSMWKDLGKTNQTGNAGNGTVRTSSLVSSYNEFVLSYNYVAANPFVCSSVSYNATASKIFYYTFDANTTNIGPQYPSVLTNPQTGLSSPVLAPNPVSLIQSSGLVDNYLRNTSVGSSSIDGPSMTFTDNVVCVEFIFRLNVNLGQQQLIKFIEFDNNDHLSFKLEYPYMTFNTCHDDNGTLKDDIALQVRLDGIDKKSWNYYVDGQWHHIFLRYNLNSGSEKREIWVDGELNEGFYDTPVAGSFLNLTPQFRLLNGVPHYKFLGDIDEIVVYSDEVCPQQIVQHYNDAIIAGEHYCFTSGGAQSCPVLSGVSVPTITNLEGELNPLDYPINYDPSFPEPNYNVVKPALTQLQNFPLPRFMPGYKANFRRNYNWLPIDYMGGYIPSNGSVVQQQPAIVTATEIQAELANNWYYLFNVNPGLAEVVDGQSLSYIYGYNGTDANTFAAAFVKYARDNINPLDIGLSATVSRSHLKIPVSGGLGYPNNETCKALISWQGMNQVVGSGEHYLKIGTDYINKLGNIITPGAGINVNDCMSSPNDDDGDPKILSPLITYRGDFDDDGDRLKILIDNLDDYLNSGTNIFTLAMISENNEYTLPTEDMDEILGSSPYVDADLVPGEAALTNWFDYLGTYKKEIDADHYQDLFLHENFYTNPIVHSTNTMLLNYGLDGQPQYRFNYRQGRETQTVYSTAGGNKYLSTPDFYPRAAFRWHERSVGPNHGIKWMSDCRNHELMFGDNRFAPFVSPGYWANDGYIDDERTFIRPAQWLALLKNVGLMGVDFYHTFHTLKTDNPEPPAGYAWMASTPVYSQAILSRINDFLTSGELMAGDIVDNTYYNFYDEQANLGYTNYNTDGKTYRFNGGGPDILVTARQFQVSGSNVPRYVISGSVQSLSNALGNAPDEKVAEVDLDYPQTGVNNLKFNVRRQGSTYVYDKTFSPYVFYQLDAWHENSHPERWSKDFYFEAEVYDNSSNVPTRVTVDNGTNGSISDEDFTDFTTYITFPSGTAVADYNFNPRSCPNGELYLWVKARIPSGSATVSYNFNYAGGTAVTGTIGCVNSSNWKWYRFAQNTLHPVFFSSITPKEYTLKLSSSSTAIQIDQIVITPDKNLALSPEPDRCTNVASNYCLGSSILTISSPTSTSSIGTSTPKQVILLNADLTVNNAFTLYGKTLICDAGVKIHIAPSSSLTVNDNTIFQGCGALWKGIEVENQTCTLSIDQSLVEDAEIAIDIMGNPPSVNLTLTNSVFDHNETSIMSLSSSVTDYSGTTITGCTFRCKDRNVHGLSRKSLLHARFNKASQFTFGDSNEPQNVFEEGQTGLMLVDPEDFDIQNNFFRYTVDNGVSRSGYGLMLYTRNLLSTFSRIINDNDFESNPYSIWSVGVPAHVTNNNFFNDKESITFNRCILNNDATNHIRISNDTIVGSQRGISLNYCWSNIVEMEANVICNIPASANVNEYTAGIDINGVAAAPNEITIADNFIESGGTYGVYIKNEQKLALPFPEITNNTVKLVHGADYAQPKWGFKLNNCKSWRLICNKIAGNDYDGMPLKWGMEFGISQDNFLLCNKTDIVEKGLVFIGSCIGTVIASNTFSEQYRGLVAGDEFSSADGDIGDQLGFINGTAYTAGNKYQGVGNTSVFGSIGGFGSGHATFRFNTLDPNVLYMETNGAGIYYTANGYGNNGGINTSFTSNTTIGSGNPFTCPTSNCSGGQFATNIQLQEMIDRAVAAVPAEGLTKNTVVYGKYYLYNFLVNSPNWLDSSQVLEDFYDSTSAVNLGVFELNLRARDMFSVPEIIGDADALEDAIETSRTANTLLTDTETYSANHILFNEILYNWLISGTDTLTTEDSTALADLANQCPYSAGASVYEARALYELAVSRKYYDDAALCGEEEARLSQSENPLTEPAESRIKAGIYPNPTSGSLSVVTTEVIDNGLIRISDLSGRIIISNVLSDKTTLTNLNIDYLAPGTYFYNIKNNNKQLSNGKLVLIKQ